MSSHFVTRRSFLKAAAAAPLAAFATLSSGGLARVLPSDLQLVADGLSRPEGIVVTPDGRVIVSCQDAAVTIIEPGGTRRSIGRAPAPNGIAMDRKGNVIVANYGLLKSVPGLLQRVDLEIGETKTLAETVDGRSLVASNTPAVGPSDEIYCTHTHWGDPYNIGNTNAAGFVYKVAADGMTSVVCDGIRGANGLCFDAAFEHLFVAQTAAGDILRFRRDAAGRYVDRIRWGPPLGLAPPNIDVAAIRAKSVVERSAFGFTDGLAMDVAGNVWVTLPFANKVVAVTPAGEHITVVHDPDGEKVLMPTNIAFGGPDLRDLYIACARNHSVWKARVGVAGQPLPHWTS